MIDARQACSRCGPKIEKLASVDAYTRVTHRLIYALAERCNVASILHVARHFGMDWKTVKDLDRSNLQHELGPVDLEGIEAIGLDEFAIEKDHRYDALVVEPICKRLLSIMRD